LKVLTTIIILFGSLLSLASCSESTEGVVVEWRGEEYVFPYKYRLEAQQNTERSFTDVELQKRMQISGLDSSSPFTPSWLDLDSTSFYFLDGMSGSIMQYDYDGNYMKRISSGLGRGPGEFEYPFDLCHDAMTNFYQVDLGVRSLVSLDSKGKFRWQKFFKENSPGNIACFNSGVIVSVTGPEMDHIFESYSAQGEREEAFTHIVNNDEHKLAKNVGVFGMPLVGSMEVWDNEFIFIPKYIPQIIRYSSEGEIKQVIRTMDKSSAPKVIFGDDDLYGLPGNFPVGFEGTDINLGSALMGDELVIWSQLGNEQYDYHLFDVYRAKTGRYQYSMILDLGDISGFKIHDENLVTNNTATYEVIGYQMNIPRD
jgi:hypothetical protein